MKVNDLFESNAKYDVDVAGRDLTSLVGECPEIVKRDFYCGNNTLTSLEGSPKEVGRNFSAVNCKITSLEGAPQKVGGYFSCAANQLRSLEGAPKEVGEDFICSNNYLQSLKDVHKYVPKIKGVFSADNNSIKSHVLGLFLIEGITRVELDHPTVQKIVNKYIKQGKAGMMKAQRELLDAELDDYAEV